MKQDMAGKYHFVPRRAARFAHCRGTIQQSYNFDYNIYALHFVVLTILRYVIE